jgi:succinyl-CoA synthetase beta subunit
MKFHEYQAREFLAKFGVPVPAGEVTNNTEKAKEIAQRLGGRVVVKAQVLMGGRGKAGGIGLCEDPESAKRFTENLLGKKLVSVQNPSGLVVEKVLVVEQLELSEQYYLAVLLDRAAQKLVVMLSAKGGMEIEEIAATEPEAIIKLHVDPLWGLCDFEIRKAVQKAGIAKVAQSQMIQMVKRVVKAYTENDADLIEINPCALTPEGKLLAVDAKVSIDDNALYKYPELTQIASEGVEDPIEAEAMKRGIAYVRLGGDIGIIGNGAGLVMCSIDEVTAAGGHPANFLDIGGGAQADKVKECVKLIMLDRNIKGLLINIFGGITRGDEVAKGILAAFEDLHTEIPVVARIEGTEAEKAMESLAKNKIKPAATMQEAAQKIVALAYGS